MYDYAEVQLLGRATADAEIHEGCVAFTMAMNIPIFRNGIRQSKTVYRRVMVLGNFATYVTMCQEKDGLKGRLIVVRGVMDDERYFEDGEPLLREVIRVAPGTGSIKVMDRRTKNDG